MLKIRFGYKVLRGDSPYALFSATAMGSVTHYHQDTWVKSNVGCGPLAVFDSFENAHAFLGAGSTLHGYHIYKCAYMPSANTLLWFRHRIYSYALNRVIPDATTMPPDAHTRLADAVLLLNKVYTHDLTGSESW